MENRAFGIDLGTTYSCISYVDEISGEPVVVDNKEGTNVTPSVVYFDDENRRHLLNLRATYAEAAGNLADAGRKQEATNLLNKAESGINPVNLPYAMASRYNSHNQTAMIYLEAAYKAGDQQLAQKLSSAIQKDLNDQKKYYDYLRNTNDAFYQSLITEAQINEIMQQVFDAVQKKYTQKQTPVVEHPEAVGNAADSAR